MDTTRKLAERPHDTLSCPERILLVFGALRVSAFEAKLAEMRAGFDPLDSFPPFVMKRGDPHKLLFGRYCGIEFTTLIASVPVSPR